ncbi:MAG: arsenate reductase ArsC [Beijerinckiaceae bacterium]|jgi:arsenate reductase (thioredoxin)|nr:arsenate reductase ArsC [Beijerinckiaceae bacterium]MDO9443584.1 arsenate reductase ArsC [Beijerinckiaceae bacterium]
MGDKVFNVLFLCTGNTARSILAEALLRHVAKGRFNAYSAGSKPKGSVNPLALKVLKAMDVSTDGLSSKGWEAFAGPDAPVMDFVFTVCDSVAGETCPLWPGQPLTAHWGIEDPAMVVGTDLEKEAAFVTAARYLAHRINAFANLPMSSLDKISLKTKLTEIGRGEGASGPRMGAA